MKLKWLWIVAVSAMLGLVHPQAAQADAIYDISVDTSLFSGPMSLFFQLTDGGNAVQNTVTVRDVNFGGGVADAPPVFEGGASGSFGREVLLSDVGFLNFALQAFTPGAILEFRIFSTVLFESGAVPDVFAFSLLDADGNPVGASDPESGALLTLNLDGREPTVNNFGVALTPVPEPGTLMLMSLALAAAAAGAVRQRRDPSARRREG